MLDFFWGCGSCGGRSRGSDWGRVTKELLRERGLGLRRPFPSLILGSRNGKVVTRAQFGPAAAVPIAKLKPSPTPEIPMATKASEVVGIAV